MVKRMGIKLHAASTEAMGEKRAPAVASVYVQRILMNQSPAMNVRNAREAATICAALDLMATNQTGRAADLLAQRLKAVVQATLEGSWSRAHYCELLADDSPSLMNLTEQAMVRKERRMMEELDAVVGRMGDNASSSSSSSSSSSGAPWKGKGWGRQPYQAFPAAAAPQSAAQQGWKGKGKSGQKGKKGRGKFGKNWKGEKAANDRNGGNNQQIDAGAHQVEN